MSSGRTSNETNGMWTRRFIVAAIVQGAIAVGLTMFLVLGQGSIMKPEVSRVIAAGGAGTWFTFGFVLYIIIGIMGVAVSALFYQYLENVLHKKINRVAKVLAWAHLLLMNVGALVSTGLLMYAGYVGGASMLPGEVGGQGFDAGQAHKILAAFVEPIGAAILLLLFGVIAGGIGFVVTCSSSNASAGRTRMEEKEADTA